MSSRFILSALITNIGGTSGDCPGSEPGSRAGNAAVRSSMIFDVLATVTSTSSGPLEPWDRCRTQSSMYGVHL